MTKRIEHIAGNTSLRNEFDFTSVCLSSGVVVCSAMYVHNGLSSLVFSSRLLTLISPVPFLTQYPPTLDLRL